jgi:hypothetical protein
MSVEKPINRAPRYDVRLGAELRIEGRSLTGSTRNLSIGGVGLEIDRPIPEGALVQITLFVVEDDVEAEGARGLELSGTVQWVAEGDRGYSVGLKFSALTPAQTKSLATALQSLGVPTT